MITLIRFVGLERKGLSCHRPLNKLFFHHATTIFSFFVHANNKFVNRILPRYDLKGLLNLS